jgi:hypothetical protein
MTSNGRTLRLIERRSVVRRLPRADVADLLTRFRHVVEVVPDLTPGRYRLTARGWVGSFRTANRAWEVRPKVGWDRLDFLSATPKSPGGSVAGSVIDGPNGLLSFLAERLARFMADRAAVGLVRGYAERSERSATVRGRIDLPELARTPFAPPDQLPVVVDDFTADVPWNRLPLAVARTMLARPGLSAAARGALTAAAESFVGVSDQSPASLDLPDDARLGQYRELFDWCRLVLVAPGPVGGDGQAFLVNLEHLFQTHVTNLLGSSPQISRGWSVRAQRPVRIASVDGRSDLELIPDIVIHDPGGTPVGVWDIKWKPVLSAGPDPADVQQVFGYAAAIGARIAGLIYPGRRFTARRYDAPGGQVQLHVVTVRTTRHPERAADPGRRLARLVFRRR